MQAVAGGSNDIFMQRLQTLECSARMLQARIHLTQLGCEHARKIRDCCVGEQVYKNDALQCAQTRMAYRIRRDNLEVAQFENRGIEDECQSCRDVRSAAGKQNRPNHNYQWIKKIQ